MQKSPRFIATLLAVSLLVSARAQTWVGGTGNNVTTAANWNPANTPANDGTATLTFATTSFPTVVVDAAYNVSGFAISGTTNYNIGSSALSIGAGGIADSATVGITFNSPITLTANATFATTSGGGGSNLNLAAVANGGNNLTLTTAGGALTVNGNLTGTGALTVNGPGVVFLNATGNTWAGGTTINSGILQIGDTTGTTNGSLPGNVTNNGQLNFKPSSANYNYGGVISGGGTLFQLGTNTLTLSGANTYTGPTTINAGGTLVIGTTNALPTATTLNINAGSILKVENNQTIRAFGGGNSTSVIKIEGGKALNVTLGDAGSGTNFGGAITDGVSAGGQLIIGPSTTPRTVGLSGTNTYSGGTVIQSGGTLLLGNNGPTGSIVGNVANDGNMIFHRGNDMTVAGVISGSGLVTQGVSTGTTGGKTTLTAANTYTGGTLVSGGGLFLANTTGSGTGTGAVTVSAGASATVVGFGGSGSMSGSLTLNAKANLVSQGTFTVGGATTINGGTRYTFLLVDATGAAGTGYGLLNITNTLLLNATSGASDKLTIAPYTLDGTFEDGLAANFDTTQSYTFTLATTTGITGFNPAAIAFDFSGFQNAYTGTWDLTMSGNNLLLNYTGGAAIPEPATSALWASLAAGAIVAWRRKSRRQRM